MSIKDEAKQIIDQLPDDATWEELMCKIYVRQAIEVGLRDSNADRVTAVENVRDRYGFAR